MFYVYLLENKTGEWYIGYTSDLRKRVREHNQELNFSTRHKGPWVCIYYEACMHRTDATRREQYLKKTQGYRLLKRRLKEYLFAKKNSN